MSRAPDAPKRDVRFALMMSPAEVSAVDDWRFANRVATRAEAVRQLVQVALGGPSGDGEWIEWAGGDRPHHPATTVQIRRRDGTIHTGCSAFTPWWHDGSGTDILAYRVVRR